MLQGHSYTLAVCLNATQPQLADVEHVMKLR